MESQLTLYLSGHSRAAFYVFIGIFISPLVPIILIANMRIAQTLIHTFDLTPAILIVPSALFGLALTFLFSGSLYLGIYRYFGLQTGRWRWILILSALAHIVVVFVCTLGYLMLIRDQIVHGW